MIHKMGFDCQCEVCGRPCYFDEVDGESGECDLCADERLQREYARLKPVYDAEVKAGVHGPSYMQQDEF